MTCPNGALAQSPRLRRRGATLGIEMSDTPNPERVVARFHHGATPSGLIAFLTCFPG